MNTETIIKKNIFQKFKRIHYSSSFDFDFPNLIEKMKLTRTWENGELNSLVLLKTPDKQLILTAIHKNTEIKFNQENDKTIFQVIEGKLNFRTKEESINLEIGELITLRQNISYNISSAENSVFLITITNINDYLKNNLIN